MEKQVLAFNPRLHGLRAVAALAVLVFHWADFFVMYDYLGAAGQKYFGLVIVDYFVRFGWLGVPLFFILSGYLLSDILFSSRVSTGEFFRRRFVRIYPAVWAQLLLFFLFAGIVPGWKQVELSLSTVANFFLYIYLPPWNAAPINGVWWTLPVELSFYLLLPFLVFICKRISVWGLFVLSMAISIGWRGLLLWWVDAESYIPYIPRLDALPGMLVYFCAGMVLAKVTHTPPLSHRLLWLIPPGICVVLVLVFLRSVIDSYWSGHWLLVCLPVLMAPGIAAVIWLLSQGVPGFKWLGAQPLVWLGEISFGIYLWHLPVLWTLIAIMPEVADVSVKVMGLGICLLITFILAHVSYIAIERPLIRWHKNRG